MLDQPCHQQLAEIFEKVLESPRELRTAVIARECGGDAALRDELQSLLVAHERSEGYFEAFSAEVLAPAGEALTRQASLGATAGMTQQRLQERLAGVYQLERELGGAGMSRVFVALDVKLQRRVVIKVLPHERMRSRDRGWLEREIQLAASLQHPHIVPLLGAESADGLVFYTMPFVAGESLRDRLAREGRLAVPEALRIWRDVVDAIAHAHASGVVHRDIKPGNILLSNRHALVADFGIARLLEQISGDEERAHGLMVGTPSYLAPEQAAGTLVAGQSVDIYQAGLVMYEMLVGTLPFPAGSTREMLHGRVLDDPAPLVRDGAPPSLVELVMQCLDRNPARRPQDAETLLAAIDAQQPRAAPRPTRLIAGALIGAALLAFAAVLLLNWQPTTRPAPAAVGVPVALAILPLSVSGDDPDGRSIAGGMSEELAAFLARHPGLRVVPSSSVEDLDYRKLGPAGVAEALHVTYLLAGNIRRDGSRVHLQARLIDSRDNSILWSQDHERENDDLLGVQTAVGAAVIRALIGADSTNVVANAPLRRTANAEAYQWYLLGKDKALESDDAGRQQRIAYFKRAIVADPTFAAAFAALAQEYAMLSTEVRTDAERTLRAEAWRAATRAVELDDTNPEALVALGLLHFFSWNFAASEAAIKRAIAFDPQVPRGYELLALLYMHAEQPDKQLAAAQAGLEYAPQAFWAIRGYSLALATNGRCEESLVPLQQFKDQKPPKQVAGIIRGLCYLTRQRWDEGMAELRWAQARGARSAEAFIGFALARAGRRTEAKAVLARLTSGEADSHGAFGVAVVHAGLGDFDAAFIWLSKAIDEDTVWTYMWHPVLDDVRRDPRFELVRQRLRVKG